MEKKIIKIGTIDIDLNKVTHVGGVGGDEDWRRYSVFFEGGSFVEIYQERIFAENVLLPQMKREDFIKIWSKTP